MALKEEREREIMQCKIATNETKNRKKEKRKKRDLSGQT